MLELETHERGDEPLIVSAGQNTELLLNPEIAKHHLALLREVQQACTREGVTVNLVAPHLKRPGIRIDLSSTLQIQGQVYQEYCDLLSENEVVAQSEQQLSVDNIVFRFTGGLRLTPELFETVGFFIFNGVQVLPEYFQENQSYGKRSQPLHRDPGHIVSLYFNHDAQRLAQTTLGDTEDIIVSLAGSMAENPEIVPFILCEPASERLYKEGITPALFSEGMAENEIVSQSPLPNFAPYFSSDSRKPDHVRTAQVLSALKQRGITFSYESYLRDAVHVNNFVIGLPNSDAIVNYAFLHQQVENVTHRVLYPPGTWLIFDNTTLHHGCFVTSPTNQYEHDRMIDACFFVYRNGQYFRTV